MTARALTTWWVVAVLALAPALARASAADAFEDKVKPVSGQLYQKAGKLELTIPSASLSLNDAFYSKYMLAGKFGYHLSEYFSVALTGAAGFTSTTGSTVVCRAQTTGGATCQTAAPEQLYQVPGQIRWIAGAELAFSPVYGKLNLFAEKAIHFDLYVLGGPDLVSYRDVIPAADAKPGVPTPGNATAVGGHVGVGGRIFLASFMALRLEAKDVIYSVSNLSTGSLQNQLFADVGLSFFVPLAR
jgi:outer membrane beta-barrel protein